MVPSVVMPWDRGCSWPKPAGAGRGEDKPEG